jgi:hypothetical protein
VENLTDLFNVVRPVLEDEVLHETDQRSGLKSESK